MITQGYIKLYRSLGESEIFQNEKLLKIFIWCLLKASHKEREQRVGRQKVKLQEGQFVFGRNKASIELNMAPSTLWDYMNLLKEMETINIESNNKFSIITVEKWTIYQCKEEDSDIKSDKKQTSNKQQMDTNKNVKNVKNNIYISQCDELWKLYPNKKGKQEAYKKIPKILEEYSLEELRRSVERYSKEVEGRDKQYIQKGSTFFNGGYVDYLDENFKEASHDPVEEPKGRILDFKIGGE